MMLTWNVPGASWHWEHLDSDDRSIAVHGMAHIMKAPSFFNQRITLNFKICSEQLFLTKA